ncbi:3'-5' exonuclease [Xanthomonas rydalmerensis]|uniref:DNA 3'-5' helicase n=1 Tax=Xanthomonas rydalmerensis TaxID=3046274 RepID=A0ABZ0JJC9_9XANT|nr:3'-5' exonuclease [Xanthomonas sp. DM-2023]WOS39912.1 3'-5' exonuclease [Xanthomonas sp. DM-2023]WOS44096.1 3'-5' exonuclease [Xanthomonas sp. DM-2023]WOS48276.1 3'-5' exonuclease [Xanthomonas sp. DM-2023]WOS52455.1 3'-5' exonuclease [Xanthomonas sp. DM-2023]WOS56639.1 3'-5' exonuclease [Xanthomonas sp. DM-2023]
MKTLPQVKATPEQLPIISGNDLGVEVIRGAAGSGKTSTALLRLRSLLYMFEARKKRRSDTSPVRVLVLTFNKTLSGYVSALADSQVDASNVLLEIKTFAKWAANVLNDVRIIDRIAEVHLSKLIAQAEIGSLSQGYLRKEVDYILGRFHPLNLDEYIRTERTGRGTQPRVERTLRRQILDEIVIPYLAWLETQGGVDWNGLAIRMAETEGSMNYDVVIVDESQDFSANQLRAIGRHLAPDHALTFVIDTAQRIYARGFTWLEAGFEIRRGGYHTLRANHRNTKQIAAFALGLLSGLTVDSDGALPNLNSAERDGPLPVVLRGRYRNQLAWAIQFIRSQVDLTNESVAFLYITGAWLDYTRESLRNSGLQFAEITRESEWPSGSENIALCTFHSSKGLEFDYVFILGLSSENTGFSDLDSDDELLVLRRLLAVAVARARNQVVLGYKPGEESRLVDFFQKGAFSEESLP